jgi:hypothetical protein
LAVGANRFATERADERHAAAVWRQREIADAAIDARDLCDAAAGAGDGVQLGVAIFVVRLGDARRHEIDHRANRRPDRLALVELAVGDLRGAGWGPDPGSDLPKESVKMCAWCSAST